MPTQDPRDMEAVYATHATRFRVFAANELRGAGLSASAEDVVNMAVAGLIESSPTAVGNWESLIIQAIKFRARDLIDLAENRHADHGRSSIPTDDEDPEDRLEAGRPVTLGTYQDFEPAEAAERAAVVARVRAAVARLDPPADEIVRRVKLEEEPAKSVAASLGKTPGRISQILKQALEQLADDAELEEVK